MLFRKENFVIFDREKWDSSKTVLLFIHGFLGDAEDWSSFSQNLPSGICGCALTVPGHASGDKFNDPDRFFSNMAGYFNALLKDLEDKQLTIYAYSMGGRVLLHCLKEFQHSLKALILESVSPGISDLDERKQRYEADLILSEKLQNGGMERFLKDWMQIPLFKKIKERNPKQYSIMMERRLRKSPNALSIWLDKFSPGRILSQWDQLSHLKMPILCLAGEEDSKYIRIMKETAKQIPHGIYKEITQSGHNCHVENVEETQKTLNAFLRNL